MGRIKERYLLRKKDNGKYYYYKTPSMKSFKTTHLTTKKESIEYVERILEQENEHIIPNKSNLTFGQYTKDYFVEGKCPRTTRIRKEKGESGLSPRYVSECRRILTTKIQPTWFNNLKMGEIRRKDVLDLREELQKTNTNGVVNDCMTTLRLIFNEGLYREELDYNPMSKINKLKENTKEKIPYTIEELKLLFPIEDEEKLLEIWKTFGDFLVEYIECNTGMRNSEVRCLKWKNVDLDKQVIYVVETFKDDYNKVIGLPKNNKKRTTIISDNLKKMLVLYREKYTSHLDPDDYVCCLKKSGKPYMKKHTIKRHKEGLLKVGVEYRGQHIYRHTFNSLLKGKVSDWDIQTTTGWSDERIQKRYTHTEQSSLENMRKGVNELWG